MTTANGYRRIQVRQDMHNHRLYLFVEGSVLHDITDRPPGQTPQDIMRAADRCPLDVDQEFPRIGREAQAARRMVTVAHLGPPHGAGGAREVIIHHRTLNRPSMAALGLPPPWSPAT